MRFLRVVLLMMLAVRFIGQTPAPASIRGVVVKWGTNEPIAQAMVEIRNPGDTSGVPLISTASGANGEFALAEVPPGRYRIVTTRKGYVQGEYGRQRVSGSGVPVTLLPGQTLSDARIEMAAGAAVSGRVSYANGDPMAVARVQILKLNYRNGRPELTPHQSGYTNDLGEYRLFWLPPGSYYVSAENAQNNTTPQLLVNPGGNSTNSWSGVFSGPRPTARISREYGTEEGQTYITSYYPGTPNWENASLLELQSGDEVGNINIRLNAAVQRRIRGVIVDSNRQPVQGTIVVTLRRLDASLPVNPQTLQLFPDNGRFQFVVTQSGAYELTTTAGVLSGRTVATVSDRDTDVSISLLPSTSLSGRVTLDGAAFAPPQQGPRPTVVLRGPGGQFTSPISPDGNFAFQNMPVSNYRVELTLPGLPDAYLQSIKLKDADVPEGEIQVAGFPVADLVIAVNNRGGSIGGRVINEAGQPVAGATVVVMPDGVQAYRADRHRQVTVEAAGAFEFRGLPAGEYYVYAWTDVDSGAWFNSAFLRNYEMYRRSFRVIDGRQETADIVAAPVAP
ncbi:MAG TPA: carboxypeptidase-like regulatory domain-containing protein [Terriglobia bacterium]|nr:carboxypeptidase-like regulatory domain-containing protein [Terriglobia bacterium]